MLDPAKQAAARCHVTALRDSHVADGFHRDERPQCSWAHWATAGCPASDSRGPRRGQRQKPVSAPCIGRCYRRSPPADPIHPLTAAVEVSAMPALAWRGRSRRRGAVQGLRAAIIGGGECWGREAPPPNVRRSPARHWTGGVDHARDWGSSRGWTRGPGAFVTLGRRCVDSPTAATTMPRAR